MSTVLQNFDESGGAAGALWQSHALRFVVFDMGNGVHRVGDRELISMSEAKAVTGLNGSLPIDYPPGRFFDLATQALVQLGFERRNIQHMTACSRSIDERTTEVFAWCPH